MTRRALLIAALVTCGLTAIPAGSSATGTCTFTGKSVAPDLGDHGTQLTIQCTDTIATTSFHTNGHINGLRWPDAKDCNFTDEGFFGCNWQPTQQAGGITYTHGRTCDSIAALTFTGSVTFADGSSTPITPVNGPCHGPPAPKPNHVFKGITPQNYTAYVITAAGRPHVKEIGIGFQCRHGDSRGRQYIVDNFAVKLGQYKGYSAYVFGDDFTETANFLKTGKAQNFHAHLSGYVTSSKTMTLDYRLSRPGCDTGLRHFSLHTK